jgi:hypothetical protein
VVGTATCCVHRIAPKNRFRREPNQWSDWRSWPASYNISCDIWRLAAIQDLYILWKKCPKVGLSVTPACCRSARGIGQQPLCLYIAPPFTHSSRRHLEVFSQPVLAEDSQLQSSLWPVRWRPASFFSVSCLSLPQREGFVRKAKRCHSILGFLHSAYLKLESQNFTPNPPPRLCKVYRYPASILELELRIGRTNWAQLTTPTFPCWSM